MADPLRIGVEVDVGQVAKLAEASNQVSGSVTRMAQAFAQSSGSAQQAASAAAALASNLVSLGTGIQEKATAVLNLRTALTQAQSALKETVAVIEDAGGATGATTGLLRQYAVETAEVALLQKQLTAATKEYQSALESGYTAQQAALAAEAETAATIAAAAAEKQAAALAAADAAAQESAANEGMVSSDVQLASEENTAAEAIARKSELQSASVAPTSAASAAAQSNAAALTANAAAATANLSPMARLAQSLLAAGLSAKEVQSALLNEGLSAKEATAAMAELGAVTAEVGAEEEAAATKVDLMTRSLAYSGTRVAAYDLGLGQLGYALGRVGAVSNTLAPILAAAFPVFAIFALIDVVKQASETITKWREASLVAAEAQHKVEEAIARNQDKIEEQRNALGNITNASADWTSQSEAIVRSLNDQYSTWVKIKDIVNDASLAIEKANEVRYGITQGSQFPTAPLAPSNREVQEFIRQLNVSILRTNDWKTAYVSVGREIELVQAAINQRKKEGLSLDEQEINLRSLTDAKTEISQEMQLAAGEAGKKIEQEKLRLLEEEIAGQRSVAEAVARRQEAEAAVVAGGTASPITLAGIEKDRQEKLDTITMQGLTRRLALVHQYGETYAGEAKVLSDKIATLAETSGIALETIDAKTDAERLKIHQQFEDEITRIMRRNEQDRAREIDRTKVSLAEANRELGIADTLGQTLASEMRQVADDVARIGKSEGAFKNLLPPEIQLQQFPQMAKNLQTVEKGMDMVFKSIDKAMDKTVRNVLMGTETVGQAFVRLGQQVEISIATSLAKMVMHWAEHWIEVELLNAAGLAKVNQQNALANVKGVISDAARAAANAFAHVPFPLNLVAAPAVFAATMAFEGLAGSAQKGMVVPNDNFMSVLHAQEMVLPKHLSTGLQSMIESGGGGSTTIGGSRTVHNHIHVEMHNHGGTMTQQDVVSAVKTALRRGQL